MNMLKMLACGVVGLSVSTALYAKPIKKKYGVTEQGKMPRQALEEMSKEVVTAQSNMSQQHYEDVVLDPQQARNDQERLAGLSAREVFILVDRSGSMNHPDDNPTGARSGNWTRWDSSRVAAESITELALNLDKDGKVDVMLWDGDGYSQLQHKYESMTNVGMVKQFFENNRPQRGSTPLAKALEEVYSSHLRRLLQNSEPFTVIVLTDGQPNDPNGVKQFFKKVINFFIFIR